MNGNWCEECNRKWKLVFHYPERFKPNQMEGKKTLNFLNESFNEWKWKTIKKRSREKKEKAGKGRKGRKSASVD